MTLLRRLDPWLPPLLLMAVIFVLSAQPDAPSDLSTVELVGRKLLHVTAYALLSWLWWRALRTRLEPPTALIASVAIAIAYACSDEFHQTFVDGRNGTPIDVAIDSVGAGLFAFACLRTDRVAGRTAG